MLRRVSLQRDEHEEAHQPPTESDEQDIHRVNCELRGAYASPIKPATRQAPKCISVAVISAHSICEKQ